MILFSSDRIQYLTQAGVIFLVYTFIMIVVFYSLSPFVDSFFGTYNSLQVGDATDEVAYYGPLFYTAVKIGLAVAVAIPMTWFIFWALHRQPSQYRGRLF